MQCSHRRRRQRRLSGQVEELETNITDLLATPLTDDDVDQYDLATLRAEGETELGAALPSLSSYSLFNSAPYGNLGKDFNDRTVTKLNRRPAPCYRRCR